MYVLYHNFEGIPSNYKKLFVLNKSRNGNLIHNIFTRINLCDNNMFVMGIKLFNTLPIDIRNETKYSKFCKLCLMFLYSEFVNTYKNYKLFSLLNIVSFL